MLKILTTGALVSKQHLEKVQKYMRIAKEDKNCIVHCGGIDAAFDKVPENLQGVRDLFKSADHLFKKHAGLLCGTNNCFWHES